MTLEEFKSTIATGDPDTLAAEFIARGSIAVLPNANDYAAFKARVLASVPNVQDVAIVGSGNWGFSLNPERIWTPFRPESDIDVAVISEARFVETWDIIRASHRERWRYMDLDSRGWLMRNGQNVYCGYVSPNWIPDRYHRTLYDFRSMLNRLSGKDVGNREVRMVYFRNTVEAVDYYKRGFLAARRTAR